MSTLKYFVGVFGVGCLDCLNQRGETYSECGRCPQVAACWRTWRKPCLLCSIGLHSCRRVCLLWLLLIPPLMLEPGWGFMAGEGVAADVGWSQRFSWNPPNILGQTGSTKAHGIVDWETAGLSASPVWGRHCWAMTHPADQFNKYSFNPC